MNLHSNTSSSSNYHSHIPAPPCQVLGPTATNLTEATQRWLKGKEVSRHRGGGRVKESTLDFYRRHAKNHIIPTMGRFPLPEVTPRLVELMMGHWGEMGLGPKSINKVLATLSSVLKRCVALGEIPTNPCESVERMGIGSGEVNAEDDSMDIADSAVQPAHVYDAGEVLKLLRAAEELGGWISPLISLFALTGVRHGEGLALMWRDVDFKKGVVTIRRNWGEKYRGGEPIFYTPKSKHSFREIPCEEDLLIPLRKWQQECPRNQWNLVFPNEHGNPHYRRTAQRVYVRLQEKAKLRHLSIHALRHTFASLHLMMGTPIPEVSAMMGHASPVITMQIYAHFIPKMRGTSMKTFTDAIFRPQEVRPGRGGAK